MIKMEGDKLVYYPPPPYTGPLPPRGLRLWVDDEREPDEKWTWAKTSAGAIALLSATTHVAAIALDHDLGGEDTTRPVVVWMIENQCWPEDISIHTQNPVGRHWLEGTITRYRNWVP